MKGKPLWKTTKKRSEKRNGGDKPKKVGNPPTYADRVSEAKAALDQAHDDYVDAVVLGQAEGIRTARRALMIALANYLSVTGGEASESE